MAEFTAKDVQALRLSSGAGMMDAKKALQENDGDMDAAAKWLREKGLSKAAGRADRDNSEGAVAVALAGRNAAIVELKCETDFVAKSNQFAPLVQDLAELVAAQGEGAVEQRKDAIDDLKVTLKENIQLGQVIRYEAAAGNVIDTYLHVQNDRGVNGVLVELSGASQEVAHDVAVHIAFTKLARLRRDDIPEAEVAEERETLTNITRAEGKPEAALDKIVEGRLGGWYATRVLLEQKYVKDEKLSIQQLLANGGAELVQFAQVVVGG